MKVNLKLFAVFVVFIMLLSACGGGGSNLNERNRVFNSPSDLVGVWTQTGGNVMGWRVVVLHANGTYEFWTALPEDGRWGNRVSGRYTVREGRSMATGRRYFCVTLDNSPGIFLRTYAGIQNANPGFRLGNCDGQHASVWWRSGSSPITPHQWRN